MVILREVFTEYPRATESHGVAGADPLHVRDLGRARFGGAAAAPGGTHRLVWRAYRTALELADVCPDAEQPSARVIFNMPQAIADCNSAVLVHAEQSSYVFWVFLVSGKVCYFDIPVPSAASDGAVQFAEQAARCVQLFDIAALDGEVPSTACVVDSRSCAIGTEGGNVSVCTVTHLGEMQETEMRVRNWLKSVAGMLTPSKARSSPSADALVARNGVVYASFRNRTVRAFDAKTGSGLAEADLGSGIHTDGATMTYLDDATDPERLFKLIVSTEKNNGSRLVLFFGTHSRGAVTLDRDVAFPGPPGRIQSCSFTSTLALCVSSDADGARTYACLRPEISDSASTSTALSPSWHEVDGFEPALGQGPLPHFGFRRFAESFVLSPSGAPRFAVEAALAQLSPQEDPRDMSDDALASRVLSVVETTAEDAEDAEAERGVWQSLIDLCCEAMRDEAPVIGLAVTDELPLLVRARGESFLRFATLPECITTSLYRPDEDVFEAVSAITATLSPTDAQASGNNPSIPFLTDVVRTMRALVNACGASLWRTAAVECAVLGRDFRSAASGALIQGGDELCCPRVPAGAVQPLLQLLREAAALSSERVSVRSGAWLAPALLHAAVAASAVANAEMALLLAGAAASGVFQGEDVSAVTAHASAAMRAAHLATTAVRTKAVMRVDRNAPSLESMHIESDDVQLPCGMALPPGLHVPLGDLGCAALAALAVAQQPSLLAGALGSAASLGHAATLREVLARDPPLAAASLATARMALALIENAALDAERFAAAAAAAVLAAEEDGAREVLAFAAATGDAPARQTAIVAALWAVVDLCRRRNAHRPAAAAAAAARASLPAVLAEREGLAALQSSFASVEFAERLAARDFRGAYAALCANPDTTKAQDAVRNLVIVLFNRREYALVCELPYLGMEALAADALLCHARQSPPLPERGSKSPYEVLYAFHVRRSAFAAAATVMCEYGERLASQPQRVVATIRAEVNAFASATAAVSLTRDGTCVVRASLGRTVGDDEVATTCMASATVLRRRTAVSRAHLALVERGGVGALPPAGQNSSGATETALERTGLYDDAFALASACERDLSALFEALARAAIHVQIHGASDPQPAFRVRGDGAGNFEGGERDLERALWEYTRVHLARYDSVATGLRYHCVVADAVLRRGIDLPGWLAQGIAGSTRAFAGCEADPAALIGLFLKYDRVLDAAYIVMGYIEAWDNESACQPMSRFLPIGRVQHVISALGERATDDESHKVAYNRLGELLQRYQEAMVRGYERSTRRRVIEAL